MSFGFMSLCLLLGFNCYCLRTILANSNILVINLENKQGHIHKDIIRIEVALTVWMDVYIFENHLRILFSLFNIQISLNFINFSILTMWRLIHSFWYQTLNFVRMFRLQFTRVTLELKKFDKFDIISVVLVLTYMFIPGYIGYNL